MFFLYEVVPHVALTPSGLATALVCLALFTIGLQWFSRGCTRRSEG